MGTPSTSTSARLAPLAPSPRSETPCDVGFAVWLPERRSKLKPGTWRSLSSVVSGPHCSSCLSVTTTASGCASTLSTPVGRIEVRVAVTSRLCCTAAGEQRDGERFVARVPGSQLRWRIPASATSIVPPSAATPLKTKVPSGWVTRPKF